MAKINAIKVNTEETQAIHATAAVVIYEAENLITGKQKEVIHYKINRDGEFSSPTALNIEAMQDLFNASKTGQTMTLLDKRILAVNNTSIVWYEPNRVEEIHFDVPEKNRKDLNRLCKGKKVHWPTLIFKIKENRLICRAIKGTARPTEKTPLYAAPLTHISATDGWVCMPQRLRIDPHLNLIENMLNISEHFYDGEFGHETGKNLASHPGGHDGLWREILKTNPKKFPDKYLQKTKERVADLLN